jgi:hypothetical protein
VHRIKNSYGSEIVTSKTCFVIMPIGDQEFGNVKLTAADLKRHYDDLIKEAILKADPSLEVIRADEVSLPGSITQEILLRLMHSDLVVADVTYPNPNVFYELGLRHACRVGTVIIRAGDGPKAPFDIEHLRHIEYENTATGLKKLAGELRTYFNHLLHDPDRPDNQLLELAKFTNYDFPAYGKKYKRQSAQTSLLLAMFESPQVFGVMSRLSSGESIEQSEINQALSSLKPETALKIINAMAEINALNE